LRRSRRPSQEFMQSESTRIAELRDHAGENVRVRGWITHVRSSGKIAFAVVRDGSGVVQTVVNRREVDDASWAQLGTAVQESCVELTGTVKQEPRAPGGVEIHVSTFAVTGPSDSDYPIQPKEHGIDFLLDNRHLWLRSPRQAAIARVRHEAAQAIRDFFDERDFVLVDTPILTAAIGERSGLFSTEYFDEGTAYLAQTGQLYGEAAAAALGRIYCFGPTFRAEKSKTRRHLAEFWMVEPEVAFNDSDDNMRLQEEFVSYIVARCLDRRAAELRELERDTTRLESVVPPFPRIHYTDAVKTLQAKGSAITWGDDLGAEDETLLAGDYDRPVFVMNYPKEAKAFYMKENPADRERSCATTVWLRRDTERSSAGHSGRTTTTGFSIEFERRDSLKRPTAGISISGDTAPSSTRVSASGWSARSHGSAGLPTCAKRSRSRG
jgi:asparaginyl-tRNA synthetase